MANRLLTPAEFARAMAASAPKVIAEMMAMPDDEYVALVRKVEAEWIGETAASKLNARDILERRRCVVQTAPTFDELLQGIYPNGRMSDLDGKA